MLWKLLDVALWDSRDSRSSSFRLLLGIMGRVLLSEKFHHRLGPRLHVQFLIYRVQVRANGAQADTELVRNLLVKIPLREQGKYFLLPFRQLFHIRRWLLDLLEMINHLARNLHRHRRSASMDLLDGLNQ